MNTPMNKGAHQLRLRAPASKTSELWKNIRASAVELDDVNDLCRGIEIRVFETYRVIRRVSHREGLRLLLETDVAREYRELARATPILDFDPFAHVLQRAAKDTSRPDTLRRDPPPPLRARALPGSE